MTCAETRDLFSALADDALTLTERAALDAHVAGVKLAETLVVGDESGALYLPVKHAFPPF